MSEQSLISAHQAELAAVELQIQHRRNELKELDLKVEEQKTERAVVNAQASVAIAGLALVAVLAASSRPRKRSLWQKVFG